MIRMVRARTRLVMTFGAACVVVASGACSSSEQMATGAVLGQECKEASDCAPPRAVDLNAAHADTGYVRCVGYSDAKINLSYATFCQLVANRRELGSTCNEGPLFASPGGTFIMGSQDWIVYACDSARGLYCDHEYAGSCKHTPSYAGAPCHLEVGCTPPLTCVCPAPCTSAICQ